MPKVLYIDDSDDNRLLVRRVLGASGIDVAEATNAIDGINMAVNNPPDLILMDIAMPDMDGLTATKRIRGIPEISNVRIVALTANAMEGDREMYLAAGCDGYISKPINIDTFVDEISTYMP